MPNAFSETDQAYLASEIGCFEWPKAAADGAAATATPETSIGVIGPGPLPIDLAAIVIHPSAAVVANSSNFATITIAKRTGGGAPVTLATLDTHLTSWSAWTPINMVLAAGSVFVSPGDAITVTITKSGAGVVIPQLYLAGFCGVR